MGMGKHDYKGIPLKQHKTLAIFYNFKPQPHEAFLLQMESFKNAFMMSLTITSSNF